MLDPLQWNSQQDMKDRCFICSIPNYEFDRCAKLENVSYDDIMANIFELFQLRISTRI